MSRTLARECSFKIIFSSLFEANDENNNAFYEINENGLQINESELDEFFNEEKIEKEEEKDLAKSLLSYAITNKKEIIDEVSKNLVNYDIKKIYKTDLAIIILAMAENRLNAELDNKIIYNEAIKIAKKYSSEKSFKFVNGILRNLLKEREND